MEQTSCFHCGLDAQPSGIVFEDKPFCCNGCKTVYEIFSANNLINYYNLEKAPGITPKVIVNKYHFLDNSEIVENLLEFKDTNIEIVTLYIPNIHCSSCIWILENLHKLNASIQSSTVNFGKKKVRVQYNSENYSLKELVTLLSRIAYEPQINLDSFKSSKDKTNRSLIYKLGVAGFAFGNIMFLSFPEYFEVGEFWLEQFKPIFRWLMFTFSLPVVFYSSQDYFTSAYKGLKAGLLNIDVPIALGIIVLFIRSFAEIIFDLGTGFFDSLSGLVFFLLLGKFFQQKTYSFLSFERDYKSYFPIGVTRINPDATEESVQVYKVKKGDRLLIRNKELLPVDCILMNGAARIDYSFVTGESKTVSKNSGDKLFAGGKLVNRSIEVEVLKTVEQSYLTQLWSNNVFNKNKDEGFTSLTNSISKRFTIAILSIAILATAYWIMADPSKTLNVFTSVLIIACPCAIALAAPFTLGNLLRIFGKLKFYAKNTSVIEQLASINTIIFDKTGTITTNKKTTIEYEGVELSPLENELLKSSLRQSNHPLSRSLYAILDEFNISSLDYYREYTGKGIESSLHKNTLRIGSAEFVQNAPINEQFSTTVYLSSNEQYKGKFTFLNHYRKGTSKLFNQLKNDYDLGILSGDNTSELEKLKKLLPAKTKMFFNQKPEDKLEYIKHHQKAGAKVLMVGDGLNDAGALAQSDVGIAVSENINVFSPACDAILDASKFGQLGNFIKASKQSIQIIRWSFVLSLLYNCIGLYFAVTGQLSPVIAAILMPLSSISIVGFTTICTNIIGRRLSKLELNNK